MDARSHMYDKSVHRSNGTHLLSMGTNQLCAPRHLYCQISKNHPIQKLWHFTEKSPKEHCLGYVTCCAMETGQ